MLEEHPFIRRKLDALGLRLNSLALLRNEFEEVHYPKGKIIIKSGRIENQLYFISNGIARIYLQLPSKETTFCFCSEAAVLFSYNSYFTQTPGYENIQLLEDSTLLKISCEKVKVLCEEDLGVANFFNRLIGEELVKTEERFIGSQSQTATERYHDLMNKHPGIIRRVQLGYIASYLGISQVTLSRIRAKLK